MRQYTSLALLNMLFAIIRAVANGPVGPAMAGPIGGLIEPANFILFFKFLKFFIIFFWPE